MSQTISQELADIRATLTGMSSDLDAIETKLNQLPGPGSQLTPDDQAALDAIKSTVQDLKSRADAMAAPPPPAA